MSERASRATVLMADEAERRGAECEDSAGIVQAIVDAHQLGFYAWFCVCCELANRAAIRRGFTSEAERAYTRAGERTTKPSSTV